jgi:hypothetical protein
VPASLTLPADEGLQEALARLGLVTADIIGPQELRERLGGELAGDAARRAAADVDLLAGLLAGG